MIADDLVAAVCESIHAMTLDLSGPERVRAYVQIKRSLDKLVHDLKCTQSDERGRDR